MNIHLRLRYLNKPVYSMTLLNTLTSAQCIENLFGIQLSKFDRLRSQLNSMIRNGLIDCHKEEIGYSVGSRSKQLISNTELTKIHNAVILAGILGDPKNVKKVFKNEPFRLEMAEWIETLFLNRQTIVGIGLYTQEVNNFISSLSDIKFNLCETKLANPFVVLPQVALDGGIDLIQGIVAQTAAMTDSDNMMAAYLNDDLDTAFKYAQSLTTTCEVLLKYQRLITDHHQEAIRFEATLDKFF